MSRRPSLFDFALSQAFTVLKRPRFLLLLFVPIPSRFRWAAMLWVRHTAVPCRVFLCGLFFADCALCLFPFLAQTLFYLKAVGLHLLRLYIYILLSTYISRPAQHGDIYLAQLDRAFLERICDARTGLCLPQPVLIEPFLPESSFDSVRGIGLNIHNPIKTPSKLRTPWVERDQ